MDILERFEAKVVKGDGCWEWTASKDHKGYGQFGFAGLIQRAHRVAYQLYIGEIPEGLCVLHCCDNRQCTNPAHLFLGTNADNVHDCMNKGRDVKASGEKHYRAKLTDEQVKAILAMHADGARVNELARELGVAHQTISNIVCHHNRASI